MPRHPQLALLLSLLGALVLAAAGCGGGDDETGSATGTDSAASVVPASAAAYLALNSDLDSAQWEQAKTLVRKFPDHQKLVDKGLADLGEEGVEWERDVDPALGPEVAVVFMKVGDDDPEPVVLTQPDDEAKLAALLEKADDPTVRREIEGWQAVAETEAQLDAYEQALEAGSLADEEAFATAMKDLPEEALLKAFASGTAFADVARSEASSDGTVPGLGRVSWASGAVEAVAEGFRADGFISADGLADVPSYTPELLERIPGGVLALASFKDVDKAVGQLRSQPEAREQLPMVEQMLGVSLDRLLTLFSGEMGFYVRQGSPIPELTLITQPKDPDAAIATFEQVLTKMGPLLSGRRGSAEVDGVQTRYVELQGVRLTYAAVDGMLVMTTGLTAIADLRGGGTKVGDDEGFKAAKRAAGLGDETSGFFYADIRALATLAQGFAGLAGQSVPPEVGRNLAPLRGLLLHGGKDGDVLRFSVFVGIA